MKNKLQPVTRLLILQGVKQAGSYDPNEALVEVEEQSAAYLFTLERISEIKRRTVCIRYLEIAIKHLHDSCGEEGCGCEEPLKEVLAREQAALDELLRGWKGERP